MKTGFNGKKREWCLLIAMGLAASVAESVATYPDMPYAGPSSMPDLPAVFTDYNPPVDSDPVNANTPAVAEWTRSNRPGDTMALTGETLSIHSGVAEGRDTKFVFYGGEATPANGLIQRLDGAQCALTLPDTLLASEMYLMWPHNENGSGNPIAINQTEAWWVGPDHAARGETFSVYGRNLVLGEGSCHLYVEGHGWLVSTTADPYKADFEVPSDLANGTYTLWAHNGCGGKYGWAKPLSLTVDSVVDWSKGDIIDVTKAPYNAAGDGATDDHGAIQAACEAAGSGDTVYFPAGTYLSSYDLFPPNGARILGDGMDSTIIQPHPNNSRSQFVRASDDSFFKDITFASDDNNMKFWYGGGSQRVTWENVRFDQRANRAEHDTCLYFPTADHLVFKNCEFYQSDNMWFEEASQIFFDGCKFVGLNDLNTYITSSAKELSLANSTCANYDESDTTNAYGWAIGRWIVGQGHGTDKNPMLTYFGGNTMTNLGPRFAAARFVGKIDSISGTQATCSELVGFSGYLNPATMKVRREGPYTWQEASISSIDTSTGTITLTRDWGSAWYPGSKVGDTIEICDYVDANSGEIFMTESLPAVVRSTPVSATANTITFSSTPSGLSGHVVAIVDGKGMGQTRRIIAHTGTTLTLDEDWNVVPNAESLAIVGECSYRMVAYGNHFDGNPDAAHIAKRFVGNPAVQPYGMANDWIVDSNIMTDLRIGIADYLWMDDSIDSYYDVTPNYFNYYANNTISNCYHGIWRNLRLHNAANIHEDIHEVGTMFRNNTIVDSVHRAIDHEQLSTSATIPGNVVFLTVLDGNTVASNTDFFYGRDGFFNQVWIGNEFVSSNGGVGLSRLNESSVLRGNAWSGFESNYGEGPGALLGLPAKVVDTSAAGIPVLNCGTDPLTWSASTDAAWMTLTASSGSVLDENSMGMLTFEVDASAVPAENPQAVITVLDDAGQEQQVTVEYVAEATVPPPPDPPPSPVLMGISVSGPASMDEKTTAQYVCT
ncbi:MAG: glycosyl hydrolase family 28-related protein, partial [Verrucomicrobiota bacterium]